MNTSFKVSLFYLLLIIPQHGNSPLPLMESWLQKDQDDGVVQRDMTSSLTGGDESFGTAHQTYQNSLIRKKKADDSDVLPSVGYRKFVPEYDRNEVKTQPFFDGRYVNQDFNLPSVNNPRSLGRFENIDNGESLASVNRLRNNLRMDVLANHLGHSYEENTNLMNDDGFENSRSWCPKPQAAYPFVSADSPEIQRSINTPLENSYLPVESGYRNQEMRNPELRESNRPEIKVPENLDDNEYYEGAENTLNGEYDEDYNQMLNSRGYIQKREEPVATMNKNVEQSNFLLDGSGYSSKNKGFNEDPATFDTVRENADSVLVGNAGMEDMKATPDSNLLWKVNSDQGSDALNKVVKNSQKALQQVQLFHQRLYNKQPDENFEYKEGNRDVPEGKFRGKAVKFDEKRLKREDEDEQKNMKTGTDEGGGGEYEDEEGKGHKDEEEYYEDAELSDEESGGDAPSNENEPNDRYVKRETAQDNQSDKSKSEENDDDSQDYELSLANAPVEHSEKSKKSSYREGEKTKKKSVRKGVKIWDQWGKWSPCSVTCGVGRSTRWRHCIGGGCAQGEKEAQIKRCTNPAC